jgi:DNA modification methylase
MIDPSGGSGATMSAVERTGRRAVLAEIDPRYVEVIVRRWQDTAMLDGDGQPFNEIAAARGTLAI